MESVLSRVVESIAKTTRYPKQLLVADADLENDLGIDSVKRVEIVAALADEFHLDLISQERDPSIRTIEDVSHWIETALNEGLPSPGTRVDAPKSPRVPQEVATPDRLSRHERPSTPQPAMTQPASAQVPPPLAVPAPAVPRATPSTPTRPTLTRPTLTNGQGNANRIPSSLPTHVAPAANQTTTNQTTGNHATGPANGQSNGFQSSLSGRVALVTGSGRGVGRTIARVLAARGVTVVINSFHSRDQGEQTAAEINATGGSAIHLWGSVANPEQVDEIFAQIEQQIGHLDMLICNASDGRIGSFCDISQEDWDRAFRTNVSGHHQCAMRASKLMQRRGGGSIITMSSIGAHRFVEGLGGQGVVKAAVESLTRYLACELAPYGIRANCVAGGPVYGDVISQYPDARATHSYWETIIPDGEMCSPMDLANTIAFLVSDEARAINGAIWTVDHGASNRAHSKPLPLPGGNPTRQRGMSLS